MPKKSAPISMALIYGVPPFASEPADGVWKVHKHIATGELLGPTVVAGFPTRVVDARITSDGWEELRPNVRAYPGAGGWQGY